MAAVGSRFQEFAHTATVNCAVFGRKSGSIVVTGGEDNKVTVWSIGKPNPLAVFSGNTSAVDCVQPDLLEEVVAAGFSSGTIRLWDLDQQQNVRTLAGHTASVRAIDFSESGKYLVSGSQDTSIKIWDIKRKSCLMTLRSHADEVLCVRFSPDSKMLVSGSADGTVKFFDYSAGKILHESKIHSGPITALDFHPNECLIAVASADNVVRFIDAENFQLVSTSTPEPSLIRRIAFDPEVSCLYTASQDALRCLNIEPFAVMDSLPTSWGRVGDLYCPSEHQLMATSVDSNIVTLWNVDLKHVNKDPSRSVSRRDDPVLQRAPVSRAPAITVTIPTHKASYDTPRVDEPAPRPALAPVAAAVPRAPPARALEAAQAPRVSTPSDRHDVSPAMGRRVEPESFLPAKGAATDDMAMLDGLVDDHVSTMSKLSGRLKHVRIVRASWANQNQRRALEQLGELRDPDSAADVLNVLSLKPALWTLDSACAVVPTLESLYATDRENLVLCACTVTSLLVRLFGGVVISNLQSPPQRGAADLTREERYEKCESLRHFFCNTRALAMGQHKHVSSKVSSAFRRLTGALEDFASL